MTSQTITETPDKKQNNNRRNKFKREQTRDGSQTRMKIWLPLVHVGKTTSMKDLYFPFPCRSVQELKDIQELSSEISQIAW